MISHRISLEDMPAAYAAFDTRKSGVDKIIVDTKFSQQFGKHGPRIPVLTKVSNWDSPEAMKTSIATN